MPKIRRSRLPEALIRHLVLRIRQREVAMDQLGLFADWCDTNPEVPTGPWFKRFPGLIACGEGDLVKTFLVPGQVPHGEEVV
jgi:hypothetical protein